MSKALGDFIKNNSTEIEHLPTLPIVARELMSISEAHTIETDKVVEIIVKDPAISAQILSVANSAYYRLSTPVSNIKEAVLRLGFTDVKNIALSASMMSTLNYQSDKKNPYRLDYQRAFKHSMVVGTIAKKMANWLDSSLSEDVFTGGILHDIGLMFLNRFFMDEYLKVMSLFKRDISLIEAETEIFGFTHANIGGWILADKWGMPDLMSHSVTYHHTPTVVNKYEKEVAIIHLSDILASRSNFYATAKDPNYPLDDLTFEILEIDEDELDDLESEIKGMVFY